MLRKTLAAMALVSLPFFAAALPAQAQTTATCYINDGYAVSAVTNVDEVNEIFSVKRKATPEETIACPMAEADADFVIGKDAYGQAYAELLPHHLVMSVSTGPVGNVVIIDLRDNKEILNVSGDYEFRAPGLAYYWERGEDGTEKTCDQYKELTADGLGTRILHEKYIDLETLKITDTGATMCEGVS